MNITSLPVGGSNGLWVFSFPSTTNVFEDFGADIDSSLRYVSAEWPFRSLVESELDRLPNCENFTIDTVLYLALNKMPEAERSWCFMGGETKDCVCAWMSKISDDVIGVAITYRVHLALTRQIG